MAKICCLHFRDCVRVQEANPTGFPLPGSTSPSPCLAGIVQVTEKGVGDLGKGRGQRGEVVLVVPAHSLGYVSNYLQHPHFYSLNPSLPNLWGLRHRGDRLLYS